MPFLHDLAFPRQASRLAIVIHAPGWASPELPNDLPIVASDRLGRLFRELDDLPERVSLQGFDPSLISLLGYKICRQGSTRASISISRGSAVVPVRDPMGYVVALQDGEGRWLTRPRVHCMNTIRRFWTGEIEIFPTVIEADIAAVTRNVAALYLGGLDVKHLSERLVGAHPRIVSALEVAA